MGGNPDYARGIGNYTRELTIPEELQGKRIFIRFAGSFSVKDVFLDGKFVGEHRGGYGAFVFELTDRIRFGESQKLLVRVNNAPQLDIMPLVGDFNFYGGIYREGVLRNRNNTNYWTSSANSAINQYSIYYNIII
jgi:beta-galactosidase